MEKQGIPDHRGDYVCISNFTVSALNPSCSFVISAVFLIPVKIIGILQGFELSWKYCVPLKAKPIRDSCTGPSNGHAYRISIEQNYDNAVNCLTCAVSETEGNSFGIADGWKAN